MPRGTDRPWDRRERDDDDEDDRPRRRRRDEDDDDDDRPRSRRRDEDDDDDRPRRRRRDDDDDYDDRPRRRGAAKKSGGGLVIGIILGVLVCGGLGFGVGGYFLYQAMGTAKARQRESNNLKQIGLAMHNQEDATGRLSAPYAQDNFGKVNKGLSWRVGILPYIEQDNVYKQYRLDEAWDSPANRRLSDTAIATYTTPLDDGPKASAKTPYRVFVSPAMRFGEGSAMFTEDGQPVRLAAIPDGTSNTIMVAHAFDQVPWAEPRELKYDPNGPLPKLGHPNAKGGYMVLMADGSVRMISNSVSEKTLRAAITRDGGEVLGGDW